jgi:hypothetical protein
MRSLVTAFSLFMAAVAAALGEAFVPLVKDPLLVWNYASSAIIAFVGGTLFWLSFRQLDRDEDRLNMLPTGHIGIHTQVQKFPVETLLILNFWERMLTVIPLHRGMMSNSIRTCRMKRLLRHIRKQSVESGFAVKTQFDRQSYEDN